MVRFPKKIELLKDRALMLAKARAFFAKREVLEVDCPIMSTTASIDQHIDLFRAYGASCKTHYLHSSPEYGMKKLLSEGIGDIYQLSHVFRDNEYGMTHYPEFTMAEWYRLGFSFQEMVEETVEFIREFLGDVPYASMTYREAFKRYTGIDSFRSSENDLLDFLEERGINPYLDVEEEGKDSMLNIIFGVLIQPHLGNNHFCVLQYFPASQAMLSKVVRQGEEIVAERFEIFYKGIELANGYHELSNAEEQLQRLVLANQARESLGKETLPIDYRFIEALERGMPDCCGVSVGFDRLMMLRNNVSDISDVMPITETLAEVS